MRNHRTKYFTLVAGLLVAACIMVFQSVQISSALSSNVQTEQSDEESPEKNVTIITITSLPAAPAIHFAHDAVCLFEIIFAEADRDLDSRPIEIPLTSFFDTLLNFIISPNAP